MKTEHKSVNFSSYRFIRRMRPIIVPRGTLVYYGRTTGKYSYICKPIRIPISMMFYIAEPRVYCGGKLVPLALFKEFCPKWAGEKEKNVNYYFIELKLCNKLAKRTKEGTVRL